MHWTLETVYKMQREFVVVIPTTVLNSFVICSDSQVRAARELARVRGRGRMDEDDNEPRDQGGHPRQHVIAACRRFSWGCRSLGCRRLVAPMNRDATIDSTTCTIMYYYVF